MFALYRLSIDLVSEADRDHLINYAEEFHRLHSHFFADGPRRRRSPLGPSPCAEPDEGFDRSDGPLKFIAFKNRKMHVASAAVELSYCCSSAAAGCSPAAQRNQNNNKATIITQLGAITDRCTDVHELYYDD